MTHLFLEENRVSEWDDFTLRTWRVQGVCLKISLFYPLWSTFFCFKCCYGLEKKCTPQRTPVLKAFRVPGGAPEKTRQHTLELIASRTLFRGGSPGRKATAACLWRTYLLLGSFLSCSVHLGPPEERCDTLPWHSTLPQVHWVTTHPQTSVTTARAILPFLRWPSQAFVTVEEG